VLHIIIKRKSGDVDLVDGAGSRIEWSTEMTDFLLALYEKQQKATGADRGVKGTSWSVIVAGMKAQYPDTVFPIRSTSPDFLFLFLLDITII
jgi:hypothetical protein